MSGTNFLVSGIEVQGVWKSWGELPNQGGRTGGTEVTFTVIPLDENKRGWTREEAAIVVLDVRLEIHKILAADAQIRNVPLPVEALKTIEEYTVKVQLLKDALGGDPGWKEEQVLSDDS